MISQNFIEDNFPKGNLTLVGGSPSVGKTAFAITLAVSMAERNQKVIYFSLEMSREQLVKRIMLQNRHLTIEENITICDTPSIGPSEVRSQLEAQSFDYILIDYLQLMNAESTELSGEDAVSSIVSGLKKLAGEFGVPIIVLSQLSRNGDFRIRTDDLAEINVAILSRVQSNQYHQLVYKSHMENNSLITHFYFDSDTIEVVDYYATFYHSTTL